LKKYLLKRLFSVASCHNVGILRQINSFVLNILKLFCYITSIGTVIFNSRQNVNKTTTPVAVKMSPRENPAKCLRTLLQISKKSVLAQIKQKEFHLFEVFT
jgi:hypothetical protein